MIASVRIEQMQTTGSNHHGRQIFFFDMRRCYISFIPLESGDARNTINDAVHTRKNKKRVSGMDFGGSRGLGRIWYSRVQIFSSCFLEKDRVIRLFRVGGKKGSESAVTDGCR